MQFELIPTNLEPKHAYYVFAGFAIAFIALATLIKALFVKSTHDFLVAGRRVGLGFGVGAVIASWTWAMAVMMSSAQAYTYGVSGLWWFTIPNGLAIIAIIPFGIYIRRNMPNGYTLSQYIYYRFGKHKPLYIIFIISMLFGAFLMALINLKGISVVMSTIYGIDWRIVPIIAGIVTIVYVILGGIWNSAVTAGIQTFLITVPSAIVVMAVFGTLGGPDQIFGALVEQKPVEFMQWYAPEAAYAFGITLALGLLANTVSDQTFWQRIWAVKPKYVGRVFLWGGTWFYGIPICLGLLGLVGASMGLDLQTDLKGDSAAVGPFVVANIGLPTWLVITYTVAILAACFSTLDAAFMGTSSVVSVDIVKRLAPGISDGGLLAWSRLAIFLIGALSVLVILSGIDFVSIVLTTYALKTAVLFPLILAVFWNKSNATGIMWGIILAAVIGMPLYIGVSPIVGTLALIGISIVVPVIWTLISPRPFRPESLHEIADLEHVVGDAASLSDDTAVEGAKA
jgi:Na+/proline symporter